MRSVFSALALTFFEKNGDIFGKETLMTPRTHGMSHAISMAFACFALNPRFRILRIPFWIIPFSSVFYELGMFFLVSFYIKNSYMKNCLRFFILGNHLIKKKDVLQQNFECV